MTTYLIIKHGNGEHKHDARKMFFKDAKDMLWNPPETWHSHMADPKKIVDME